MSVSSLDHEEQCGYVHVNVYFYPNMTPRMLRSQSRGEYPFCCVNGAKHFLQQLNIDVQNIHQQKFILRRLADQRRKLALELKNLRHIAC
jgi:hypothetical protein